MANYKSRGGLTLLDYHEATTTETDYTYTPSPALSPDKYSEIIVKFNLEQTAAFELRLVVNGIVGVLNYSYGSETNGSAIAHFADGGSAHIRIGTAPASANEPQQGTIEITVADYGTQDIHTIGRTANCAELTLTQYTSQSAGTETGISSIKLMVSTSTWIAGSKIAIYGVLN